MTFHIRTVSFQFGFWYLFSDNLEFIRCGLHLNLDYQQNKGRREWKSGVIEGGEGIVGSEGIVGGESIVGGEGIVVIKTRR